MEYLHNNGISCVFHYIPLHSSKSGLKYGRFSGIDNYTTKQSERLIRFPMYWSLEIVDVNIICNLIRSFYGV